MIAQATGLLAALFYICATALQARTLVHGKDSRRLLLSLGFLGLTLHLLNVATVIYSPAGYDFGFFHIATLFSWVMVAIALVGCLRQRMENLLLLLLPVAIAGILSASFVPSGQAPLVQLDAGVALHSILGILSFSLITLAAIQVLLVAWLSRELKRHHYHRALRHVPPLQTMEELLFSIIRYGFVALLAVILSGFVFMDDMFAQHLVHKTVLTLVSSVVFGILLWGRQVRGWRGRTAMRWILSGYAVLLLAYFGSKFVLEVLLQRV